MGTLLKIPNKLECLNPLLGFSEKSWQFKLFKMLKFRFGPKRSHMRWGRSRAEPGNFVWRGQVTTLIYLSRQLAPHTHIYFVEVQKIIASRPKEINTRGHGK